jgi:hypothetical protein
LVYSPVVRSKNADQSLTEVPKQMPAVCDLDGMWCRLARSLRIQTCAIAAHDLYTGMSAQPSGCAFGTSIRQQVDHLPLFQIAEDRPVPLPLSPGPVIDPNYTW